MYDGNGTQVLPMVYYTGIHRFNSDLKQIRLEYRYSLGWMNEGREERDRREEREGREGREGGDRRGVLVVTIVNTSNPLHVYASLYSTIYFSFGSDYYNPSLERECTQERDGTSTHWDVHTKGRAASFPSIPSIPPIPPISPIPTCPPPIAPLPGKAVAAHSEMTRLYR